MTGDAFRRVSPGQPLQIPADAYNAFVDAALAQKKGQTTGGALPTPDLLSSAIVRVKNASGADRSQFDVLGIDGPIFDPSTALNSFRSEVTLVGVAPDETKHSGRFVILLEPLKAGTVGRAAVVGLTVARLHDPDGGPTGDYADIRCCLYAALRRTTKEVAPIVWQDDERDANDFRWVVIHLDPLPLASATTTTTTTPAPTTTTPEPTTTTTFGPTTSTTQDPNVAPCTGTCRWVWSAANNYWTLVSSDCAHATTTTPAGTTT